MSAPDLDICAAKFNITAPEFGIRAAGFKIPAPRLKIFAPIFDFPAQIFNIRAENRGIWIELTQSARFWQKSAEMAPGAEV